MTEAEIRERVRALVLAAAPVKAESGDGTASLGSDLGYDSLGREELAALLEDEFPQLRVPDTAFDFDTVADVEDFVIRLLEATV